MTPGEKATADEHMIEAVDWFEAVAKRFAGVDLQYRRSTGNSPEKQWPHPWRATLIASKNERAGYRITVYGVDMYDAIVKLRAAVEKEDLR